jgi:hypothetical protein
MEHETNLRLRVRYLAVHEYDERGGYLGYHYHESERGSLAEYRTGGYEEVNQICEGQVHRTITVYHPPFPLLRLLNLNLAMGLMRC